MSKDSLEVLRRAAQVIYDKKGMNVLGLDIEGLSSLTDYLLIGEGHVDRHVVAMAKAVVESLEEVGIKPLHVEGLSSGEWVVLDYPGFMIHFFMPGYRERFALETLWEQSKLIELSLQENVQSGR